MVFSLDLYDKYLVGFESRGKQVIEPIAQFAEGVIGMLVAQNKSWVNIDSVFVGRELAQVVEQALAVEIGDLLVGWVVDTHGNFFLLVWLVGLDKLTKCPIVVMFEN